MEKSLYGIFTILLFIGLKCYSELYYNIFLAIMFAVFIICSLILTIRFIGFITINQWKRMFCTTNSYKKNKIK